MKQATFLKINPADSVVVCLQPKQKGDIIEIDGLKITVNHAPRYRHHQVRLSHRSCQDRSEGWRLGE